MSYLKSTNELKQEVLRICGELTDGNSEYDSDAVRYLNDLYQGLLAGGSEFGIDIAEPWHWAQAKRPILLELLPKFDSTSATLTQGSTSASFAVAPTSSLQGWFFQVTSQPDIYRIATHTAGQTAFTLDQPYIQDSGVGISFTAFKLDYELTSNTIIIDETNNKIDFRETSSSSLVATLTPGSYTPTALCAEIKTQMEAVGAETYTVSFNSLTRKFTIAHGGAYLDLLFDSGVNINASVSEILGYNLKDYQGTTSYTSSYILNGITRLTKPLTMYREAPSYYQSARDAGKIFMIDSNTFLREFPLNRLNLSVPDKFCAMAQSPEGLWKVRFNAFAQESLRVEVDYIPVTRDLVDSTNSYPVVPGAAARYLVFGAAHFILTDKNDTVAPQYLQLAQAKLKALVNDNRKNLSLGGTNYGKIVPRPNQTRLFNYNGRS